MVQMSMMVEGDKRSLGDFQIEQKAQESNDEMKSEMQNKGRTYSTKITESQVTK